MLIDRRKNHRGKGSEPFGFGRIKWVTTEWLAEHLDDPHLSILDVQPDIRDYIMAHIPGSVYMNEKLLRVSVGGIPGKWISPEAAQSEFRRLGLRSTAPVVIYTGKGLYRGWGDGLDAFMVAYSLVRFGHESVYILDGGFDKWVLEGKAISMTYPAIQDTGFTAHVRAEMFVEYPRFKEIHARDDILILDARPERYFQGEGPWIRNGHIPGSINLPCASLMEEDNPSKLKEEDALFKLIDQHGIHDNLTLICTSGTGREATLLYTVLKHYFDYSEVRLFEGSYTEWSSHPENPVINGPEPG
jgi:thiosulfate/3-mercaptopyruvate sulfurtransferase